MVMSKTIRRFAGVMLAGCLLAPLIEAQTSPNNEEVITLDPFQVSDDSIKGYLATQSVSLNRATTEIVNIPQPINVITQEYIQDSGALADMDILRNTTPGLVISTQNAMDTRIRGLRAQVGSMDGAVVRSVNAIPSAIIERMEVIKGPASLTYGSFAAAGGYVNRVSKKPTEDFRASISATVGTDSLYRGVADVSGPISDSHPNILYRVIVEGKENTTPGWSDAFDNSTLAYGRVTFKLNPKNTLEFGAFYQDRNNVDATGIIDLRTVTDGTRANPGKAGEPLRDFELNAPFSDGEWQTQMLFWDARYTSKPTEDIGFQAYYSMEYNSSGGRFIRSGGIRVPANGIIALNANTIDGEVYHHNVQTDITWKKRTEYFENRITAGADMNYRDNMNVRAFDSDPGGVKANPIDFNNLNAFYTQPTLVLPYRDRTTSSELAAGFFAQDELSLLQDRLILTAGLRYNYVTSQRLRANAPAAVDPNTGQFIPGVNLAPYQGENITDTYTSERYGVVVKPLPNMSVFWGSSDAFKGNGTALLVGGIGAPPEISLGEEWGVKFDSVSNFTGTISFFTMDVTNRLGNDPVNSGLKIIRPPLHNEGWEASLAWDYNGLTLIAGYYKGNIVDTDTGLRPDRAPNETANFIARYKFAEGSSMEGLAFGAGGNWVGEDYMFNGARRIDPYKTVDVFVSYSWDKWKAQLNGSNVLDENYSPNPIQIGNVKVGAAARWALTMTRTF